MSKGKILIIEDEALVAHDIKNILVHVGYAVVGIADNRDDALNLFKQHEVDLIVCDIQLKGQPNGIDTISELIKIKKVLVIYLTAYSDQSTVEAALRTEPSSYLLKPFTDKQLTIAVELAIKQIVKEGATENGLLSEREIDVLKLMAQGENSERISNALNISFHTVKTHRRNMLQRLQLKNSSELILWATKKGYI